MRFIKGYNSVKSKSGIAKLTLDLQLSKKRPYIKLQVNIFIISQEKSRIMIFERQIILGFLVKLLYNI
jgi:hypothetical protein